jgi:hypothetical protein
MKQTFLLFLILFSISKFSVTQNRIEILVNGVVQNVTDEAIRVKSASDFVEMRIYFANTADKKNLIEKIEVQGCKYEEPGFAEQTNGKNPTTTTYKPTLKSDYLSFKLKVGKVTNCAGDYFSFSPLLTNNSKLNTFKGFQSTYNFYFVL